MGGGGGGGGSWAQDPPKKKKKKKKKKERIKCIHEQWQPRVEQFLFLLAIILPKVPC